MVDLTRKEKKNDDEGISTSLNPSSNGLQW